MQASGPIARDIRQLGWRPASAGSRAGRARACIAAGLLSLLWPDLAAAHAVLLRGTPSVGASVPAGHLDIDLHFNSRIEHAASQLQLQGSDGAARQLTLTNGPVDALRAVTDLGPGSYTIRWQVLAVDGHLTRGAIPFTVKKDATPGAVSTAQ